MRFFAATSNGPKTFDLRLVHEKQIEIEGWPIESKPFAGSIDLRPAIKIYLHQQEEGSSQGKWPPLLSSSFDLLDKQDHLLSIMCPTNSPSFCICTFSPSSLQSKRGFQFFFFRVQNKTSRRLTTAVPCNIRLEKKISTFTQSSAGVIDSGGRAGRVPIAGRVCALHLTTRGGRILNTTHAPMDHDRQSIESRHAPVQMDS